MGEYLLELCLVGVFIDIPWINENVSCKENVLVGLADCYKYCVLACYGIFV